MSNGKAALLVDLLDVYGERLSGKTEIRLFNQRLGRSSWVKKGLKASQRLRLEGLAGYPHGLYRVVVDPDGYRATGRFVNIPASGKAQVSFAFAIDPEKIIGIDFPAYEDIVDDARHILVASQQVLGFSGKTGQELYDSLDEIRRAGLLNIVTKCEATFLGDGTTVLSHIEELMELRGDRFFARVPKTLREETKNSVAHGLFHPAGAALHHPPEGFGEAGSFKTEDSYGNLQLTFFMRGSDCVVDIDIDDAGGIQHLFQVVRNWLTGRPTHPYNIHEILVYHQKLDPGYRFRL